MDYAYNSAFGIARILCTLQYEKSNFALRASIWSSAEISEALRAFPAILVVREVKTWYTANDVKYAATLRIAG